MCQTTHWATIKGRKQENGKEVSVRESSSCVTSAVTSKNYFPSIFFRKHLRKFAKDKELHPQAGASASICHLGITA